MAGQHIEAMPAPPRPFVSPAPAAVLQAPLARWPSLCAICRGWGRGRVCADCLGRFATAVARCRRCALPVPAGVQACGACLVAPPPFDASLACVDYGAPWDRLIASFKFHQALDLGAVFASRIAAAAALSAEPLPDVVLPVPLGPLRLRERGYNQAWELARRVAGRLGLEAQPRLLLRLRETAHQLALPPAARAGNVRAAFAVEPGRRGELAGRRVALVDDVMTTASTVAEISRVLAQAGASHVAVWVFARTPRPGLG